LPIGEPGVTVIRQAGSGHHWTATARVVAAPLLLGNAPTLLPIPIASFTVKWEACGHNGGEYNTICWFGCCGSCGACWHEEDDEHHGNDNKEARHQEAPVVETPASQCDKLPIEAASWAHVFVLLDLLVEAATRSRELEAGFFSLHVTFDCTHLACWSTSCNSTKITTTAIC